MSAYLGSALSAQSVAPKSEAVVYRYVETRRGLLRADENDSFQASTALRVAASAPGTLEIEVILTVRGHMEPGYGFRLDSATCDGREFPLTKEEVANIEIDRTEAYADEEEGRREDAAEHRAEIRRGR